MDKFINLMQGQDMDPITSTFPNNCSSYLADLRKSPTFAMSLGAKELFHTNFLAFLLEIQSGDQALGAIQNNLKKLLFGHDGIGRVITWREKYSLDLVVMPAPVIEGDSWHLDGVKSELNESTTIAVVIEAKLKSIPTTQQLEKYDSKLKSGITFDLDDIDPTDNICKSMKLCIPGEDIVSYIDLLSVSVNEKKNTVLKLKGKVRRILLGPTDPEKTGWDYIPWRDVVNCLVCEANAGESTQCNKTELLQRIICDYRESLKNILEILRCTNSHVDNAITNCNVKSYYDAITDKSFRNLRIHDLVGKYANNILEGKVFKSLQNTLGTCGFNISDRTFTLNSYTFFSNQQPGVTFEWLCKEGKSEVSFGVTIQGYDYRHFISVDGKDKDARNLILKELENILDMASNNWFLKNLGSVPLLAKKANNIFYVFNESKFRYSKAPISDFKLKCLSGAVSSSLGSARGMVEEKSSALCRGLTKFFE